jgi:formylmethanofuran dehydrogenase subunit E
MEEFHGYRSPGLVVGGMMVDTALRELGSTPYLHVVTETVVCLPDAVQLLTPCTVGNGLLKSPRLGKIRAHQLQWEDSPRCPDMVEP